MLWLGYLYLYGFVSRCSLLRADKNRTLLDLKIGPKANSCTPGDMTLVILSKLKELSETYLDGPVRDVIVTVPQSFNKLQRSALLKVIEQAGLYSGVLRSEAIMAIVAHDLDDCHSISQKSCEMKVLVIHFGGATFEAVLAETEDDLYDSLETIGDKGFGGVQLDRRLLSLYLATLTEKYNVNIEEEKTAIQKLSAEIVKAEHALSSQTQTRCLSNLLLMILTW